MQTETKAYNYVFKIADALTVLLMALLFTMVTFQVLNRFILHIPAAWTEELSRYCFVWLSMFGAVRASKNKVHLKVDIVETNLKGNAKTLLYILAELITLAFCIVLTVTGFVYTRSHYGNYCQFGKFPLYIIYMVLPLTGIIMCMVSVEAIIEKFKGLSTKTKL